MCSEPKGGLPVMATAHPKRDIGPRTPFLELPGDLMWPTVRRLGELGLDAELADAIRRPTSEATVRRQLLELREAICLEGVSKIEGARRQRPRLLHDRYTPIAQQVQNIWRWNKRYGWGLPKGWDERLDVPPAESLAELASPENRLISVNVVAFLEAKDGVLGEHRTFDAYWEIIKAQHPNQYRNPNLRAISDSLQLLPGITHEPGVRIEVIEHGANWEKEAGLKPMDVRSPETSPHAGLLASAAQHPRRIRKMDGTTVPFEWIAGYQCSVPGRDPWRRVPLWGWSRGDRQVDLGVNWDGYTDPYYSVPVVRRSPLGSGTR